MKKLFLFVILFAITLGLTVAPQAAESATITPSSEEKSEKISVDYNAEESYIVTIPASVTFTDAEKTVERGLQVSDVVLDEGSSLSVKVTSLNNFQMRNGDGYIAYKLIVNYNQASVNNKSDILIVLAGESSGVAILDFVTDLDKRHAPYTGKYTDTLTFTVSVD